MSRELEIAMAYVDGEMSTSRRAEFEAAIAADSEIAQTVKALYASQLPYQTAFSRARTPAVPASLSVRVEELAAVSRSSFDLAFAGAAGSELGGQQKGTNQSRFSPRWWHMIALLLSGLIVGYLIAIKPMRTSESASDVEPWISKVSSYHSMYSRETVMDGDGGIVQAKALQSRLRAQNGLELQIPDLSSQGLSFVRAQQLQFDGKMVLQLVYSPKDGAPLALCLTPADAQPEREVVLDGVRAMAWHAKGWAYVMVGGLPSQTMQAIRRELPASLI